MSLEPFDADARVCLAVVALGTPQRLRDCLESLAGHSSRHPFSVICVVNPAVDEETATAFDVPPGVSVVRPSLNLGWPGGLHFARQRTRAEYLVWVQEDMRVLDGWLDELVDAADANPAIAAFGSFAVDDDGEPAGISAGRAHPPHDVSRWNETDTTASRRPTAIETADWVTSKGLLTRTTAFDEIGGPNPSLFPLNHVDKEYTTHLRAHGHAVALVPTARLVHLQSQSAPSMFRRFVSEYRDPQVNATIGPLAESLAAGASTVEHDCKPWFPGTSQNTDPDAAVAAAVARESTTMLIAFAKWADRFTDAAVGHQRDVDNHAASIERHEAALALSAALAPHEAAPSRVTRALRALRRR